MYTLKNRSQFDIKELIRCADSAKFTREYNADLRRLLPWTGHVDSKRPITEFGVIQVVIRPQESVDSHRHDEEECFIVTSGKALIDVEGQSSNIKTGDVIYIPRFWLHQIRNPYMDPFHFIDIYWDYKGRSFDSFSTCDGHEEI